MGACDNCAALPGEGATIARRRVRSARSARSQMEDHHQWQRRSVAVVLNQQSGWKQSPARRDHALRWRENAEQERREPLVHEGSDSRKPPEDYSQKSLADRRHSAIENRQPLAHLPSPCPQMDHPRISTQCHAQ